MYISPLIAVIFGSVESGFPIREEFISVMIADIILKRKFIFIEKKEKIMFDNVGEKIQKAAKIIWIVGVTIYAVVAFCLMLILVSVWAESLNDAAEVVLLVFGTMVLCIILFCVAILWLYFITLCIKGFGKLVENSDKLTDNKSDEEFVAFNE